MSWVDATPAIGFGILLLVLIGTSWINANVNQRYIEATEDVRHTYQVLAELDDIALNLLNAETGQRGYLLTGDETYLEPYRAALLTLDRNLSQVARLTEGNPTQQRRLSDLRPLVDEKLSVAAETIRLRRDSGFDAALTLVETDRGKTTMDRIRAQLEQMQDEEANLLVTRQGAVQESREFMLNIALAATAAGLIVVVLVAVAFLRMTRNLRKVLAAEQTGRERLEELLEAVRDATNKLAASAAEILAGTGQQAAGAEEQSAAVNQTVATIEEIQQTSQQAAERAKGVADAANRAAEIGNAGRTAIERSIESVEAARQRTESIAETIVALAEQAQSIGEITATVTDIAEQTNLLALNAGVEAARAGEHGAGFNVVAREIKELAYQAKSATAQVRKILGDIQQATNNAVMATEEGTRSTAQTLDTVREAGETINKLAATINDAARAASQIAASSGQQATGMTQIQAAMKDVSQTTTQNLASTRQAERAAKDLNDLGTQLKSMLGH